MATATPPQGDGPFEVWADNWSAQTTPAPTLVGLVTADCTAFNAALTDYKARRVTAETSTTRTKIAITQKRTAKNSLMALARAQIKKVEAFPTLTAAQRDQLMLPQRDVHPTPRPAPGTAPQTALESTGVITVRDPLDAGPRFRRPFGALGALVTGVFLPLDADPPASPENLPFIALATKPRTALPLPADADGKKLYAYARWYSARGELGPVSAVAVTTIAA
ncbi:MAG: hypothetical protein ACAI43_20205 [Phycisphaerae bacterium]